MENQQLHGSCCYFTQPIYLNWFELPRNIFEFLLSFYYTIKGVYQRNLYLQQTQKTKVKKTNLMCSLNLSLWKKWSAKISRFLLNLQVFKDFLLKSPVFFRHRRYNLPSKLSVHGNIRQSFQKKKKTVELPGIV